MPARVFCGHVPAEIQIQIAVCIKERRYVDNRKNFVAIFEIDGSFKFVRIEQLVALFVQ